MTDDRRFVLDVVGTGNDPCVEIQLTPGQIQYSMGRMRLEAPTAGTSGRLIIDFTSPTIFGLLAAKLSIDPFSPSSFEVMEAMKNVTEKLTRLEDVIQETRRLLNTPVIVGIEPASPTTTTLPCYYCSKAHGGTRCPKAWFDE